MRHVEMPENPAFDKVIMPTCMQNHICDKSVMPTRRLTDAGRCGGVEARLAYFADRQELPDVTTQAVCFHLPGSA